MNTVRNINDIDFANEHVYKAIIDGYFAKQLVKRNYEHNRAISKHRVDEMAHDMKAGKWRGVASDPIKFDRDGNLLNGQHRLSAIISSGETVEQYIVTGLDAGDYRYMDTGQSRTVGQLLERKIPNTCTAVGKCIYSMTKGAPVRQGLMKGDLAVRRLSTQQLYLDWQNANYDTAIKYGHAGQRMYNALSRFGYPTCYGGIAWIADTIYGEGFSERFEEYIKSGSPGALRLCQTIMRQYMGGTKPTKEKFAGTVLQAVFVFAETGELKPTASYNKYDAAIVRADEKLREVLS